jgi:hypothetical protein
MQQPDLFAEIEEDDDDNNVETEMEREAREAPKECLCVSSWRILRLFK